MEKTCQLFSVFLLTLLILVSDIEGFTSISEKVTPSELITSLEEYFNSMSDIIQDLQGCVGDYIGDAIFGFWNAPIR
jgi:adenylate cyclase